MDYISNNSKIIACDIGASNCDPTPHIDNLLKNTDSKLYGFEPNKIEFEKLINIMHYSYNSYDFADFLIRLLEKRENLKIVEKYRNDVAKLKILKKY
tara:strand:- start:517 stop:807 length:291 start_codon:yes stop_codon:yes gene_type:complete